MQLLEKIFSFHSCLHLYTWIIFLLAHDFIGEVPLVNEAFNLFSSKRTCFQHNYPVERVIAEAERPRSDNKAILTESRHLSLYPAYHLLTHQWVGHFVQTIQ